VKSRLTIGMLFPVTNLPDLESVNDRRNSPEQAAAQYARYSKRTIALHCRRFVFSPLGASKIEMALTIGTLRLSGRKFRHMHNNPAH
jgi:hypothetical protein